MVWRYAVIVVAGYLLGNISMGLIVSERYHMDIREHGSGNAGTTNVLRTLGWLPSVLTLVGDVLKSFLACMLGKWLAGAPGLLVGGFSWAVVCLLLCGLCAIGTLLSLFIRPTWNRFIARGREQAARESNGADKAVPAAAAAQQG